MTRRQWEGQERSSPGSWMDGHHFTDPLLNERRLTRLEFGHDALQERIALMEAEAEWVRAVVWGLFWRLIRGALFLGIGLLADQSLGSGAILKAIRSHIGL